MILLYTMQLCISHWCAPLFLHPSYSLRYELENWKHCCQYFPKNLFKRINRMPNMLEWMGIIRYEKFGICFGSIFFISIFWTAIISVDVLHTTCACAIAHYILSGGLFHTQRIRTKISIILVKIVHIQVVFVFIDLHSNHK